MSKRDQNFFFGNVSIHHTYVSIQVTIVSIGFEKLYYFKRFFLQNAMFRPQDSTHKNIAPCNMYSYRFLDVFGYVTEIIRTFNNFIQTFQFFDRLRGKEC